MYRWTFLLALLAVIAFGAGTDNAFAQATRTWVSGVGDDANPCSRTAPCKTFAGAISKTAAGGEIDALDPGGFGSVTITKSITIDASHTLGGVSNSGANGVIVNAGVNDVVVLRGLDFDSYGGGPGLNGVRFLAGGALHIEDSVIRDNKATVPNGMGVTFVPSTGSPRLFITNTVISGNGSSSNGGVHIEPTGSAGAVVTIANSTLFNNLVGVRAVGTSTTGRIDINISNSNISGNLNHGVAAVTGSSAVDIMLNNSVISNNGIRGVSSSGANAVVRIGSSVVSGNANGLMAVSSGKILSFGNNQISGNTVDGAPTGNVALR